MTPKREACDRAFALACPYSGGQDLVEEMVAVNYWPLGRRNPEFRIELVSLHIFGPAKGLPFPRFGLELKEGENPEDYVADVEGAREIVGRIYDKEYLARKATEGTMPRLNRVFEEIGVRHKEHTVPLEVLASIEDK